MKFWNLYPVISAAMPFQMALDEILFRESDEVNFRIYSSAGKWISIGYSHQVDPAWPKEYQLCRRITGGGIVYHGEDLIFSITAGKKDDETLYSVRLSYLKIHEAVQKAFERLGVTARFYRCDEELARGKDCFRFPIATDLAVAGRKVAGGAQKRSAGRLLHQESVQLLPRMTFEQLEEALKAAFEDVWSIRFKRADLDPQLLAKAEDWAQERYKMQYDVQHERKVVS